MTGQVLWMLAAYLLGSLPFAVWLGRLAGVDPRTVGDGNPGATNAWKAGGWRLGAPVLLLDFSKAALPVAVARQVWRWDGGWLVAVALAPVLGHASSPFLGGRGGKGLAATFGVWCGLTLAEVPLVLGGMVTMGLLGLRLQSGWAVLVGMGAVAADGVLRTWPAEYWAIWLASSLWLVWAYRRDLQGPPQRPPLGDEHG